MEGGDLGQLIVAGIIIVATILGPLVERMLKKKRSAPPTRPVRREPMLPYENLVEDTFGPYIQRRKEAYEARQRELAGEEEPEPVEILEEEEEPEVKPVRPPPRPAPVMRIVEELPAVPGGGTIAVPPVRRRGVSLEDRIFRNRRLSTGAKLVLAREILDRRRR